MSAGAAGDAAARYRGASASAGGSDGANGNGSAGVDAADDREGKGHSNGNGNGNGANGHADGHDSNGSNGSGNGNGDSGSGSGKGDSNGSGEAVNPPGPVFEGSRNCYCRTPFEWFVKTPLRQLVFFTVMQIFVYYDRGLIAGFLPVMSKDLGNIDNSKAGLLGSCFIIGYMVACPVFAIFTKRASPFLLMTIGMAVWCGATILCGVTNIYGVLLTGRILTGVGEASFAGLAPTCIDDIAPLKSRTLWLGIFFCAMPAGAALGYIAGGLFSTWHWQFGFISEGVIMVPFVIITYFIPKVERDPETPSSEAERASLLPNGDAHASDASTADTTVTVRVSADGTGSTGTAASASDSLPPPPLEAPPTPASPDTPHPHPGGVGPNAPAQNRSPDRFWLDLYDLITNWVWVLITLGYAALTFVIGALTFWAPQDFSITLHIKLQTATTAIGGITFACGVLATFLGGFILDKMGGGRGMSGVARAMLMSAFCSLVGVLCAIVAVETDRLGLALAMLGVADLFLFATGAPVPSAILAVVPTDLRSMAMSFSIFFMHLLGDMPSPFLLGFLTDKIHDVRLAMLILVLWLLWTVAFWTGAWALAKHYSKKEREARHNA